MPGGEFTFCLTLQPKPGIYLVGHDKLFGIFAS